MPAAPSTGRPATAVPWPLPTPRLPPSWPPPCGPAPPAPSHSPRTSTSCPARTRQAQAAEAGGQCGGGGGGGGGGGAPSKAARLIVNYSAPADSSHRPAAAAVRQAARAAAGPLAAPASQGAHHLGRVSGWSYNGDGKTKRGGRRSGSCAAGRASDPNKGKAAMGLKQSARGRRAAHATCTAAAATLASPQCCHALHAPTPLRLLNSTPPPRLWSGCCISWGGAHAEWWLVARQGSGGRWWKNKGRERANKRGQRRRAASRKNMEKVRLLLRWDLPRPCAAAAVRWGCSARHRRGGMQKARCLSGRRTGRAAG